MNVWDRLAGPKNPVQPVRRVESNDDSLPPVHTRRPRRKKRLVRKKADDIQQVSAATGRDAFSNVP